MASKCIISDLDTLRWTFFAHWAALPVNVTSHGPHRIDWWIWWNIGGGMNWVHLWLALIISIELSLQWNLGRKIHKYLPRIIVSSIEIWLVKPSCWEYTCNSWYTSILFSKGQTRAHFPWKFCTLKLLKLCIEAWSRTLTILRGFAGARGCQPENPGWGPG